MWRPYAVEFKNTILVHVVIGCLMGYTTIDRFMSLHRTVVLMPYFLAGHMLRRYKIFVPYAKTWPQFACAVFVMAFGLGGDLDQAQAPTPREYKPKKSHKKKQPAARRIALLIDEQGRIAKIYDPAGTGEFPAKVLADIKKDEL